MFNKDWAVTMPFDLPIRWKSEVKNAMVVYVVYPSIPSKISNMLCLSFDIFWSSCLLCENSIKSDG